MDSFSAVLDFHTEVDVCFCKHTCGENFEELSEVLPREKAKVKYNDEKENKKNKMIVVIKIAA